MGSEILCEMIDVKELRVGNLVLGYYAYDDENDQEQEITSVCRVLSIDSVGAHEYPLWVEAIGKSNDVEEYDGFVPIPLTEEWLLKFGLIGTSTEGIATLDDIESEFGDTYWWEERIKRSAITDGFNFTIVRWGIDGEFTFSNHELRLRVKHVHQLQNLYFALTGKELELKSDS